MRQNRVAWTGLLLVAVSTSSCQWVSDLIPTQATPSPSPSVSPAAVSQAMGGDSLSKFRESLVHWTKGHALEIDVLEEGEEVFAFNVTRCRYAEMYRELGIPQLGPILSCSRDFALIEGFNPSIRLTRTQTLMEGASFCDFRYRDEA